MEFFSFCHFAFKRKLPVFPRLSRARVGCSCKLQKGLTFKEGGGGFEVLPYRHSLNNYPGWAGEGDSSGRHPFRPHGTALGG